MIGKYDNVYKDQVKIVKFKYFPKNKKIKIKEPYVKDVEQINGYAQDISEGIYAGYTQEKYIIYIFGNKGTQIFKIN